MDIELKLFIDSKTLEVISCYEHSENQGICGRGDDTNSAVNNLIDNILNIRIKNKEYAK